MEEQEQHDDKKFWWFILLVVIVAVTICTVSVWLYQADGTVNLDRSLPKYISQGQS